MAVSRMGNRRIRGATADRESSSDSIPLSLIVGRAWRADADQDPAEASLEHAAGIGQDLNLQPSAIAA
jgi:hypothetical protein